MTAIPGVRDTSTLLLICDDCGRAFRPGDPPPVEWQTLWICAVQAGWKGRSRPVGPHVCDLCAPGA